MRRLEIIPDLNRLEESIELAEKYDCAFEYNDFFIPDVLDDPVRQKEIIKRYIDSGRDRSDDTMHGAFLDVTVHSEDRLIREASELRVRQSMEIAEQLGVGGVVFHTGRIQNFRAESYLQNWTEKNCSFFMNMCEAYPAINIYMENMFDEAGDVLARLAAQMKSVSNFGICLDYSHAIITGHEIESWFKELAPFVRHMHMNDNDLKNDQHLSVGNGQIDWEQYKRLVKEYQIKGNVLVEVTGIDAQRRSLEYMREHQIEM